MDDRPIPPRPLSSGYRPAPETRWSDALFAWPFLAAGLALIALAAILSL